MPIYTLVTQPSRVPVPGGKLIEELFGRVNTGTDTFSLAHMVAPAGWSEPPQTPSFGELTLVVRGRMRIEVAGEALVVEAGQALWVEPGARVHYRNPFDEDSEYYAFCLPAFTPERARRDDESDE
ncbi:MAG: cupin domain-containing protein [Acidobacteriota bacterium]|nr:cupin domain-containing protein [Acidobacteriota bacterium]